jgi:hypothetical protein
VIARRRVILGRGVILGTGAISRTATSLLIRTGVSLDGGCLDDLSKSSKKLDDKLTYITSFPSGSTFPVVHMSAV